MPPMITRLAVEVSGVKNKPWVCKEEVEFVANHLRAARVPADAADIDSA